MPAEAGWSRRIGRPGPRLLWAGGLLLVAVGLFMLYLFQSGVGPFNSDGASMILQAQAMLHGNPLLKGWRVADVSFYTTELPEYVVVVALRGLRPDVVHICGALTYTLTVLLAAFLARGRATGRAGAVRALIGRRDHARARHHRRHRGVPGEPGPRRHRGADPAAAAPARPRA